jgi:hypothetical protein
MPVEEKPFEDSEGSTDNSGPAMHQSGERPLNEGCTKAPLYFSFTFPPKANQVLKLIFSAMTLPLLT